MGTRPGGRGSYRLGGACTQPGRRDASVLPARRVRLEPVRFVLVARGVSAACLSASSARERASYATQECQHVIC